MIKVPLSALDPAAKTSIENLQRVIPRDDRGLLEVVWPFFNTGNLAALNVDPERMRALYPADRYTITVLVQAASLQPWGAPDIRPYLQGMRVLEISDPAFVGLVQATFRKNTELEVDGRLFSFFENRLFVADAMLAAFAAEEQVDYQIRRDLQVIEVEGGVVHPLELSEGRRPENRQFGGVTDGAGQFIELSNTVRSKGRRSSEDFPQWYVGANPANPPEDYDFIDEEVVFLGPLSRHYGHFLLEGIARLWYFLDANHMKYKAVYLSEPGVDRFNDVFTFFGIAPQNLIKISKPTRFRKVIVPEQSFELQNLYHPLYKETVDRIKLRVPPANVKKVYFSKEMRFNNRGIGEKPIEDVFTENGYQIFYPERLSMFDTIALLKGCDAFAASSGTNAHNAMFLNDGATSIVLNRSPHVHYVQTMLDRMKQLDAWYVEANISVLPAEWSAGPFLFGPTRELLTFLSFCDFNYDAQKLYDRFPKYMIEFFKAWGRYYNDDVRKASVEPPERVVTLDQLIASVVHTFAHMAPDMALQESPDAEVPT